MPFFRFAFVVFAGIFLGFGMFSFLDDDGFLFLEQNTTRIGAAMGSVITTVKDKITTISSGKGGGSSATNGDGLNLLLISQAREGYVKEYLTICAENQTGKLDTQKRDAYAPVECILGINIFESKFYPAGDGCTLPSTDLPAGANGEPRWDGSTYSLKNWNCNNHASGGRSAAGGPLQYIDGTSIVGVQSKSIYNKGTATPGGIGDCYLFPDAVAGLNHFLQQGAAEAHIDLKSVPEKSKTMVNAVTTTISHNRGQKAMNYLYGIDYNRIYNGLTSVYLDDSRMSMDESVENIKEVYNSISGVATDTDITAADCNACNSGSYYWMYNVFAISQGWYMDTEAFQNFCKYGLNSTGLGLYNKAFPRDKAGSIDELRSKVQKRSGTLASVLGISAAECDSIYGTAGGTYKGIWNLGYGFIFKLSERTSKVYRNGSNARIVHCLDSMASDHLFGAICSGRLVYEKMLKYAGVNVDQTSPVNNSIIGGSYKSTGSEFEKVLKAHGCNMKKLTKNRYKVLLAANKMAGTTYVLGGSHSIAPSLEYSTYDCSSYVYNAIMGAGISGIDRGYKGGVPFTTYTIYDVTETGDGVLKKAYDIGGYTVDDLLPGDILLSSGHVLLYVGIANGKAHTMEAMGSSFQPNGFHTREISTLSAKYKVLRLIKY